MVTKKPPKGGVSGVETGKLGTVPAYAHGFLLIAYTGVGSWANLVDTRKKHGKNDLKSFFKKNHQ